MKIRVGRIPYLNSEPFYYELDRDDIELRYLVPSALSTAMENGEIDAGPLPLVDYFRLEDRLVPLGRFCIATMRKAMSILLYSKRPIEDLDGATIGITGHTSTSRRLLAVLLTRKFNVKPAHYVALEEPSDAFLVIGDEALKRRYGVPDHPHRYDLGEEWHNWTGLPFVFAVWAVQKDVSPRQMSYLENVLYSCIDEGLEHVPTIHENRLDLRMSLREVVEYYRGFRYWAGVSEQKAMDLFRKYVVSIGTAGASNA